jgi:hypothetical protein
MIPSEQEKVKKLRTEYGNRNLGAVTIDMVYGGMRGIKGILNSVLIDGGANYIQVSYGRVPFSMPKRASDSVARPSPNVRRHSRRLPVDRSLFPRAFSGSS